MRYRLRRDLCLCRPLPALVVYPLVKRRLNFSRRQRSVVSLVLSITVGLHAVAQIFHQPVWLVYLPPSLSLPLIAMAFALARKGSRWTLAAASAALLLLLGPGMGLQLASRQPASLAGRRVRVVCLNAASWEADLKEVSRRTAELEPDILLLQEMWWLKHLKSFRSDLPGFVFRGDGTGLRGTCIGTNLPVEVCSVPPPNKVLGAIVSIEGQEILLLTLHGAKPTSGFASPLVSCRLQRQQAEATLGYIDRFGLPVILGGDFNAPPAGPLSEVLEQSLVDVFRERGRGYGMTFPAAFPLARLDHVMISPGLARIDSYRLVDVGSDHLAVVVDLVFQEKADFRK